VTSDVGGNASGTRSILAGRGQTGGRSQSRPWFTPPPSPQRPLRILALNWRCINHPQAGGAEINLFAQARRWARDGHQVTVVCANVGRGRGRRLPSRQLIDGVSVRRLGNRVTVYPLAAWFLLRHAHSYDCVLDIANGIPFFAPLFTRTPVTLQIHHVHGRQWFAEFPAPVAVVGRFLEDRVTPQVYRSEPVIAVSPSTAAMVAAQGIAPARIEVIYNGVDLPAPVPDCVRDCHRIIYVGRLKTYKRLDRLVSAVVILRQEFPTIRLDIVGDGDSRAAIERQVAHLELQHHVVVHGFVDEATKSRLLAAATLFATPSMHEGWGLAVIEANAHGCPAVAYDVPGLRVAIRDGETGVLAQDDAGFATAIGQLLRDPQQRDQYAAAARRWASSFDWDATARATLTILVGRTSLAAAQHRRRERRPIMRGQWTASSLWSTGDRLGGA